MTSIREGAATSRFVEGFALGMWQANCYVLGDRSRGRAVVVDPGEGGHDVVRDRLRAEDVTAEAIILTHGHIDHVWSAPELAASLDVPILLHDADRWLWEDPTAAFGRQAAALASQIGLVWDADAARLDPVRDGQTLSFAGFGMTVRHTPGHTPGSCVFVLDDAFDEPIMLSGDLLFAGSVGRTDFPRGSWDEQMRSLRDVVMPMDDRTVVLSGHGPETTVGRERATNPFLRQLG